MMSAAVSIARAVALRLREPRIRLHPLRQHRCARPNPFIATPTSLKRQSWLAFENVGLNQGGCLVKSNLLCASVIVAAVAAPVSAQAQGGFPGGFAYGASEGYRVAGPVGAVV